MTLDDFDAKILAELQADSDLTDEELGRRVGLTGSAAGKRRKKLKACGLIERHGRVIKILDEAAMIELADFKDRHGHIATDWFPEFG